MILIHNARIVNEERIFHGSVLVDGDSIADIFEGGVPQGVLDSADVVEADGAFLLPGVIDTHVHFRDPGFPDKADFSTESRAAVAGGVTSVLDMPNTKPLTITVQAWEDKMAMAAEKSYCNYGFYIGATNTNLEELKSADYTKICGVKLFLGSSTGGMLVDNQSLVERIFREVPALITVHAEDESIIRANSEHYKKLYGDEVPIECHPQVRSTEACYRA
ncbi:MAG: amidohydrolase family protein, partial [Paludibacteraceae bacterium]|nr:amidohydrolase family protein [Paludibacteraceae bacterium]